MLDEKNIQLVSAKEELSAQNDLLNIANKNITDSIIYAKNIQEASIPTEEQMHQIFGDCMVFFKPCNIVSGDFYWAFQSGRYRALAVADCTGHGVPGALMSMLGVSMLNDIIANANKNNEKLSASAILESMRRNVIKALHQDADDSESLDGMDMALIIIDDECKTMQFAGAYRPLVLIRNNELTQIKGDKMPIGICYGVNSSFTNHTVELQDGDCIYAYTDGITDQFKSGDSFQKFGRQKLFELLLENHQKPFSEQKTIYSNAIEQWRVGGENETSMQTDDMLLVGIKI